MSNRNWRDQAFTSLCSLVSFILLEKNAKTMKSGTVWTSGMVEEAFAGTGVGRKSIEQIIKDHGLDPKTVYQRLKVSGIEAKDDDKIKKLADEHDATPIKILTIMLADKI